MKKRVRKNVVVSSIVIAIILFAGILIYNYSQKDILFSPGNILEIESAPTKNGAILTNIYGESAISFATYGFVQFPASSLNLQDGKNYYIWIRQARPSTSGRGIYVYNDNQVLISDKETSAITDGWYWTKYNKINQPNNFIFTSTDLPNGIVIKGDGQTGIVYADKLLITEDTAYDPNGVVQQNYYIESESANRLSSATVVADATASNGEKISLASYGFAQFNWVWDSTKTYSIWTRQYRPAESTTRGIYLYNGDHSLNYGNKLTTATDKWEWVYHGDFTKSQFGDAIIAKGDGLTGVLYLDRILVADVGYIPENMPLNDFCQSHPFYSSPTSFTSQACCYNKQVVNSNSIAPGDSYNRFLCYNGQVYIHDGDVSSWWQNVIRVSTSCDVKGNYYASPNYPNPLWQGGWKQGNGNGIACGEGKVCKDSVCVSACGNNIIDSGEECDTGQVQNPLCVNCRKVPIAISNCAELQKINDNLDWSYYLANDIDCSSFSGFIPIGNANSKFNGILDGKQHVIKNLKISRSGYDNIALFAFTGSQSQIKNLGLERLKSIGKDKIGTLVSDNKGSITNSFCYLCYLQGSHVGGIVYSNSGFISNSYSNSCSTTNSFGGIAYSNVAGSISNSYSVAGIGRDFEYDDINSLADHCAYTSVRLFSENQGTILNSYFDTLLGNSVLGIQIKDSSLGAKKTLEMKQRASFVGLDFDNTWAICNGRSYLYFKWQNKICDCSQYINEQDCNTKNPFGMMNSYFGFYSSSQCSWYPEVGCIRKSQQLDATIVKEKNTDILHLFYDDINTLEAYGQPRYIFHEISYDKGISWKLQDTYPINSLVSGWNGGHYDPNAIVLQDGSILLTFDVIDNTRTSDAFKSVSMFLKKNTYGYWEPTQAGVSNINIFEGTGGESGVIKGATDDQIVTQLNDGSILFMSLYLINDNYPKVSSQAGSTYFAPNKGIYSSRYWGSGVWKNSILYDKTYFGVPTIQKAPPVANSFAYDPATQLLYMGFSGYYVRDLGANEFLSDPYVVKSADKGITWNFDNPVRIGPHLLGNNAVKLFVANGKLYAIVSDTYNGYVALDLYVKNSDESWTKVTNIINNMLNCYTDSFQVTKCGSAQPVPIVFSDGTAKLFYAKYLDGNVIYHSIDITQYLR
ncbi:MAG: hypothetical protein WC584_05050 [Candidatus Pacearchaeota archaeon]